MYISNTATYDFDKPFSRNDNTHKSTIMEITTIFSLPP